MNVVMHHLIFFADLSVAAPAIGIVGKRVDADMGTKIEFPTTISFVKTLFGSPKHMQVHDLIAG